MSTCLLTQSNLDNSIRALVQLHTAIQTVSFCGAAGDFRETNTFKVESFLVTLSDMLAEVKIIVDRRELLIK